MHANNINSNERLCIPQVIQAQNAFVLSPIDGQIDGCRTVRIGRHEIADA